MDILRGVCEIAHTGLSPQEADEFRQMLARKRAEDPAWNRNIPPRERARLYYEWKGVPVPDAILAQTARTADMPEMSKPAAALATKMKIDPRLIVGTGPRGKIVLDDIRKVLDEIRIFDGTGDNEE